MNGTRNEVGLLAARQQLGNLVHDVTINSTFIYLTDRGRPVAAIVPLSAAEIAERVSTAEQRAEFRKLLDKSSLGAPDAKAAIARTYREQQALPDRWTQLHATDLRQLFDLYRERREVWQESHELAVERVIAEVDFESDKGDVQQ